MSEKQTVRVFKNTYKQNENQPEYTNKKQMLYGEERDVAVWVNQDKNGNDYLSFVIKDAEEDGAKPIGVPSPPPVESKPKEEVDLPF
jgi:uncharacterized protein (DUF736 family)|tara:strand:+ start:5768 stop:6028 length:261 start_codon:yes stop_codon:yes gene_type:complete